MALDKFIPEIVSSGIIEAFTRATKFLPLTNSTYDGVVRGSGDTVKIVAPTAVSAKTYSGTVTYDELNDSEMSLIVNQSDYIAFDLPDTKAAVTPFDIVDIYGRTAIESLASKADKYFAKEMAENSDASNKIDTITLTKSNIVATIEQADRLLMLNDVPDTAQKFIVVSPVEYSMIRTSSEFLSASQLGNQVLLNGQVGQIFGLAVIVSNNLFTQAAEDIATGNPVHKLIPYGMAGAMATATAIPISSVETLRREATMATGVRAMHHYGAKVIRPKAVGTIYADTGTVGTA